MNNEIEEYIYMRAANLITEQNLNENVELFINRNQELLDFSSELEHTIIMLSNGGKFTFDSIENASISKNVCQADKAAIKTIIKYREIDEELTLKGKLLATTPLLRGSTIEFKPKELLSIKMSVNSDYYFFTKKQNNYIYINIKDRDTGELVKETMETIFIFDIDDEKHKVPVTFVNGVAKFRIAENNEISLDTARDISLTIKKISE